MEDEKKEEVKKYNLELAEDEVNFLSACLDFVSKSVGTKEPQTQITVLNMSQKLNELKK